MLNLFRRKPTPQTSPTENSGVNRRVFQTHRYDGSKPVEQWAQNRLQIICVQLAHTIRKEIRSLGVNMVPAYWYECIYLAYFFLTFALLKTEFMGNPTYWADEVAKGTLKQLLRVRFEGESSPVR